jgi:phosphatidylserine decarboxylase
MNNIYYFFLFVILSILFFYRKPTIDDKILCTSDDIILSPAYGTIEKIIINKSTVHIIIFLSVFDIHYQYYPIKGYVIDQIHDMTGKYELAYELNKSSDNEKIITTINTKHGNIKVIQIAGKFVRRIVTTLQKINEYVLPGQELGMIKFGSRVDIIIPNNNVKLLVKENEHVNGPYSVLCKY